MTTPVFHVAQCGCVILNDWEKLAYTDGEIYVQATVIRSCDADERPMGIRIRRLMCNREDPRPINDDELDSVLGDLGDLIHAGYNAYDLARALRPFTERLT